jgi:hypothetical protein
MNTRNITTVAAFAAACLAGSTAYAGPKPSKKIIEPVQESCITGDIGFDIVSNYITKGGVQNNQGFIIQPYADLHFRIYKGAGALTSVTTDIGIWNSFHGHHAASLETTRNWYEFDFQAGLTFNFDKLAISPYYKIYESPASNFQNTYVVGGKIAYDDSDLLGAWALHPYAFVEFNLEGTTGNNFPAAAGSRFVSPSFHGRGQYYEVGIAPAHSWGDLTLSLPITAGFGSGDFYLGNRGFGFIGVGAAASYALNFVPACLGKWSVSTSATYYRLGGTNTGFRAGASGLSSAQAITDKNQLVFQGGLKVAF